MTPTVSDHGSLDAERNMEKSRLQRKDPFNCHYKEEQIYYDLRLKVPRPPPPTKHDREKTARK